MTPIVRAAAVALLALCLATTRVAGQTPAETEPGTESLERYDVAIDEATDRGLAYLAGAQKENGAFPSNWGDNTGIASLCIMAFAAKGHLPGVGPYGDMLDRSLDFVLASEQENGMLIGQQRSHGPMYEHCISTLMLSELSGMVDAERQRKIDEVLPRALEIILASQKVEKLEHFKGGWRYLTNSTDSDISCTGWPLMALRSARNCGADVPIDAIERGLGFVMHCRTSDGGFAYQPGQGAGAARTGVALLCLELCGHHRDKTAVEAGDWVLKHPPRQPNESYFYYAVYYCSQGMFQLGDEYWQPFARHLYELLLKEQQQNGSWPAGSASREGECYATAMSVLALGVPYCQLPIYQR